MKNAVKNAKGFRVCKQEKDKGTVKAVFGFE